MKKLLCGSFIFLFFSCSEKEPTAQEIIDNAIVHYGGEAVYNSEITFGFREIEYKARYQNENYRLERSFEDSLGLYKDVLINTNFVRTLNDTVVELSDEWIGKYSNSVNSVIYFFRIPFHLNDQAVNKELIGESTINDKEYYKIKVWFDQNGGGEDFSDVFVYWVNKEDFTINYFAYEYQTNGGGKRFREMVNSRTVNGLLVVDYVNYKPKDISIPIVDFDNYFQEGGMEKLSEIINKNVEVTYLEK